MPVSLNLAFTPIQMIKAPYVNPAILNKLFHLDATYEDRIGVDDRYTEHGDNALKFNDVVYGKSGFDYFSTGGGDDKVVVGDNDGTWRGSGNEFGNATIVDVGADNDRVTIDAQKGAFEIYTGEGRDWVSVKGGDYVKINAYDGDTERDTFKFSADFHGKAEIHGVDSFDFVDLRDNGHWHQTAIAGDLAFYNDLGGTVQLMGISAGYESGHPDWAI